MAKKKLRAGDIFSLEVEKGLFIFGRIVFDVSDQYMKKYPTPQLNYLDFFNKCFLVETFRGLYSSLEEVNFHDKATTGTFVVAGFYKEIEFKEKNFQVVGHKEIDPKEVIFPETFSDYQNKSYFSVGELYIPVPLTGDEIYEIKIYPSFSYGYWEIVYATLQASGRADLILAEENDPKRADFNYFKFSDIRSNPELRRRVYKMIGEDMDLSYYELALKHGYDLGRLYE